MFYGAIELYGGMFSYENIDSRVFNEDNRVMIESEFILDSLEMEDKYILTPTFLFTTWKELKQKYAFCNSSIRVLVFAKDTEDDFIYTFLQKRLEYISKTELGYSLDFRCISDKKTKLTFEIIY